MLGLGLGLELGLGLSLGLFPDVAEVHLTILIRATRAQSSHSSQKRELFVGACLDSIPIGG